jgi:hypothetical protein
MLLRPETMLGYAPCWVALVLSMRVLITQIGFVKIADRMPEAAEAAR